MKIKTYKIKSNPNNPRLIKDDKFRKLVKSIREFPEMLEKRPLVCSKDEEGNYIVLGGNMRLKASKEAGLKEMPIILADDWNEAQKKEFIIKDNVGFGQWNWDDIANEWDQEVLEDWGLDLPGDLTFEELEAEEDDYEMPDEIKTNIVKGDIIEIGEHKLLCGDSTSSDDVAKLMNEEKADMVFTDPPYNIENEDYHSNIFLFTENAHIFVMHDDRGIVNYLRESKLDFLRFYVANFGFSSPRGNDPYLQHILVSQEKNGKAIPHKNLHDGFSSIIKLEYRFRLKDDKTNHKHQKPINFISLFIKHFSNENNIILDLFLGSGSTMIAAHQLKRRCYGMELDEKYCQVIIDRMLKLDETLEVKINGKEYQHGK